MVRIYLTNLAKYNEGELFGKFVKLGIDKEDLQKELEEVLGEDEEYFVTDYETDIQNLNIGEYVDIFRLNEQIRQIEEENINLDVLNAIMSEYSDLKEAIEVYNIGDYSIIYDVGDEESLGYRVVEEGLFGINIPSELENYIDYSAIGRDLTFDGYTIFSDLKLAICFY